MRSFTENSSSVLRYAVISTGLYSGNRLIANNLRNENVYSSEEDAIIAAARKCGLYNIELEKRFPIIEHLPVSRLNLFETTLAGFGESNVVAVRGDAQNVLGLCRYYSEKGRVFPMSPEKLNDLRITASLITKEAFRVIAVASKNTNCNNLTRIVTCQTDMTFEGLICIREPLLSGAAMNISRCLAANIKVIMTCEDINDNNRYIANALGIIHNDNEIVTSQWLATMKEGLFRANVPIYRLYLALNINQKRILINYLKDSGEVVGVLARDLDEIILLRDADAGFSQSVTISSKASKAGIDLTDRSVPVYNKNPKAGSKTGCEAIKFISDVIVSEPDKSGAGGFNAMINSIAYSKVIYQNLLRAVRYLLASQSARFFIVLYSALVQTALLDPVKLLFCGLIIDFAAVIVIAFEHPARDIMSIHVDTEEKLRHPIRHNTESVLFGLLLAVLTAVTPMFLNRLGITVESHMLSSALFCGMILTQLVLLSETKKDGSVFVSVNFNRVYGLILVLTAIFIAAGQLISPLGNLFGMVRPTLIYVLVSASYPIIMLIVYEVYKLIKNSGIKRGKKNSKIPKSESSVKSFFSSGFRVEDKDDD
jgi:P-type Ca2+ transporter type 2C